MIEFTTTSSYASRAHEYNWDTEEIKLIFTQREREPSTTKHIILLTAFKDYVLLSRWQGGKPPCAMKFYRMYVDGKMVQVNSDNTRIIQTYKNKKTKGEKTNMNFDTIKLTQMNEGRMYKDANGKPYLLHPTKIDNHRIFVDNEGLVYRDTTSGHIRTEATVIIDVALGTDEFGQIYNMAQTSGVFLSRNRYFSYSYDCDICDFTLIEYNANKETIAIWYHLNNEAVRSITGEYPEF